MRWALSHRFDPRALPVADRHYSRRTPGSPQFVQPGRTVVLLTPEADALWVSSWPFPELVRHAWPGAWQCSLFRNESGARASELIREAVAATQAVWGMPPAAGMVTFVNPRKIRRTREPGRCFRLAGFRRVGTTAGGLVVLQLRPVDMPASAAPLGWQGRLFGPAAVAGGDHADL